jgi:hypothetical protein
MPSNSSTNRSLRIRRLSSNAIQCLSICQLLVFSACYRGTSTTEHLKFLLPVDRLFKLRLGEISATQRDGLLRYLTGLFSSCGSLLHQTLESIRLTLGSSQLDRGGSSLDAGSETREETIRFIRGVVLNAICVLPCVVDEHSASTLLLHMQQLRRAVSDLKSEINAIKPSASAALPDAAPLTSFSELLDSLDLALFHSLGWVAVYMACIAPASQATALPASVLAALRGGRIPPNERSAVEPWKADLFVSAGATR